MILCIHEQWHIFHVCTHAYIYSWREMHIHIDIYIYIRTKVHRYISYRIHTAHLTLQDIKDHFTYVHIDTVMYIHAHIYIYIHISPYTFGDHYWSSHWFLSNKQHYLSFEQIELPAKLLDYFLLSNKGNINACIHTWIWIYIYIYICIYIYIHMHNRMHTDHQITIQTSQTLYSSSDFTGC